MASPPNLTTENLTVNPPRDEITAQELEQPTPEPQTLETPLQDTGADLVAAANQFTTTQQADTDKNRELERLNVQAQQQRERQTALTSELENLLETQPSRSARLLEEENKRGVEQGYTELQKLNEQISSLTAAYDRGLLDVENQPIARQFVTGQQAALQRQRAVELGALTSAATATQGNIALSQQLAQRTVDAEFADSEQRVKTLSTLIDLNYNNLSATEKARADELKADNDRKLAQIEQQKEERAKIFSVMQDAAKNGADANTLLNIVKSESPEEALLNSAEYLQQADYQVIEVGGHKKLLNKNTGDIVKDLGAADIDTPKPQQVGTDLNGNKIFGLWNPESGSFDPVSVPNIVGMSDDEITTAINTAISTLGLSQDARKAASATLNQHLANGDIEAAQDALETLVRNNARASEADKFSGWDQAYTAVQSIDQALKDFVANGGDTGILAGKTEEGLQKLGRTLDPQLAEIVNRIRLAIINYRSNVSGAAFTESEAKEYERIFPSVGNTPELNQVKIDSLLSVFEENKTNFIRGKVGSVSYDRIFGKTMDRMPLPSLTSSYNTLDDLVSANPEYISAIEEIESIAPNITDEELLQELFLLSEQAGEPAAFNQPLSMGQKGLDKLTTGQTQLAALGNGTITGFGSDYWKAGLDFVLSGGFDAPVKLNGPVQVVKTVKGFSNRSGKPLDKKAGKKQNSGFGNQVTVRLPNNYEIDFSHLERVADLKPGMTLPAGAVFGTQGNTGMTYGNTGVHLDITARDPDGNTLTAKEVAALLGDIRLS